MVQDSAPLLGLRIKSGKLSLATASAARDIVIFHHFGLKALIIDPVF